MVDAHLKERVTSVLVQAVIQVKGVRIGTHVHQIQYIKKNFILLFLIIKIKCQNNGRCTQQGLNYICSCNVGFTGNSCESRDSCSPNPV
jgi:hypothetical protein